MAKATKAMSPGQRLLRHVEKANEFTRIAAQQPDTAVGRVASKSYVGRSRNRMEEFASGRCRWGSRQGRKVRRPPSHS